MLQCKVYNMYVCVCNAVTDKQLRKAARDGTRTLKELKQQLRVAQDCGRCAQKASKCLKDKLEGE